MELRRTGNPGLGQGLARFGIQKSTGGSLHVCGHRVSDDDDASSFHDQRRRKLTDGLRQVDGRAGRRDETASGHDVLDQLAKTDWHSTAQHSTAAGPIRCVVAHPVTTASAAHNAVQAS